MGKRFRKNGKINLQNDKRLDVFCSLPVFCSLKEYGQMTMEAQNQKKDAFRLIREKSDLYNDN